MLTLARPVSARAPAWALRAIRSAPATLSVGAWRPGAAAAALPVKAFGAATAAGLRRGVEQHARSFSSCLLADLELGLGRSRAGLGCRTQRALHVQSPAPAPAGSSDGSRSEAAPAAAAPLRFTGVRPRPPARGASLEETHPHLAAEWDVDDNDLPAPEPDSASCSQQLTPRDVSAGSGYRAGWKCGDCGHRWKAAVRSRACGRFPAGCPECSRLRKSSRPDMPPREAPFDERRLRAAVPHLVAEWHPRNELTPDDVTFGSAKMLWWRCAEGHEWRQAPRHRSRGAGCPFCASAGSGSAVPPEKSLAVLNPKAAAEWHPERNGPLTPETIRAKSLVLCWWRCSACSHEWRTTPTHRTCSESGCPACAGQARTDWNNLEARFPEVAAEWDAEANGGLKPSEVMPGSNRKFWWRCRECGHRWEARANHRTSLGHGCPRCARKRSAEATRRRAEKRRAAAAQLLQVGDAPLQPPGSSHI
eukprot:tig00000605_g2478.t1